MVAGMTMLAATRVLEHLHRRQDRHGQDDHQHGVDARRVQARRAGDVGIERREQQRAIAEEHHGGDDHGHGDDRHDVAAGDAEDAAE